ncbi:MAG: hypothetical protein AAF170_14210 [Bacteroidota bacterium]
MSETPTHTPGPWHLEDNTGGLVMSVWTDDFFPTRIADVPLHGNDCWDDDTSRPCRSRADAHLIAAAPDLYAALRELVEAVLAHDSEDTWMPVQDALVGARAALSRATPPAETP